MPGILYTAFHFVVSVPCKTYLAIHYCSLVQPLLHAAISVNRYQCFRAEPSHFAQNLLSSRRLVFSVACLTAPPLISVVYYSTRPCGFSANGVEALSREDKMVSEEDKNGIQSKNAQIQGLIGSITNTVSASVGFGCSVGTVLRMQRLRRSGRLKGVLQNSDVRLFRRYQSVLF